MESLKFLGANFRELLKFYKFMGTLLRVFTYIYKRKYEFITLIYWFVEDIYLWMRGTPDFNENLATMKSKDSTVSRTCYQQKYVPRARKIMTTHEHCPHE